MDDALVLTDDRQPLLRLVLILVLMDDALVQLRKDEHDKPFRSLNPCCNG